MKIYGSHICSGCREIRETLDEKNIPYEFIEITENITNLRAFLKLRDTLPMYDAMRAEGRVGIPLVELDDGTYTLEWEEAVLV